MKSKISQIPEFIFVENMVQERLCQARFDSGLTLKEVAKLMRCSLNNVSRYENGLASPKVGYLGVAAKVYGKPLTWFLGVGE